MDNETKLLINFWWRQILKHVVHYLVGCIKLTSLICKIENVINKDLENILVFSKKEKQRLNFFGYDES